MNLIYAGKRMGIALLWRASSNRAVGGGWCSLTSTHFILIRSAPIYDAREDYRQSSAGPAPRID